MCYYRSVITVLRANFASKNGVWEIAAFQADYLNPVQHDLKQLTWIAGGEPLPHGPLRLARNLQADSDDRRSVQPFNLNKFPLLGSYHFLYGFLESYIATCIINITRWPIRVAASSSTVTVTRQFWAFKLDKQVKGTLFNSLGLSTLLPHPPLTTLEPIWKT